MHKMRFLVRPKNICIVHFLWFVGSLSSSLTLTFWRVSCRTSYTVLFLMFFFNFPPPICFVLHVVYSICPLEFFIISLLLTVCLDVGLFLLILKTHVLQLWKFFVSWMIFVFTLFSLSRAHISWMLDLLAPL